MLFGPHFHILALFRKFEIGRKMVKNQEFTPFLFGETFGPEEFNLKSLKSVEKKFIWANNK